MATLNGGQILLINNYPLIDIYVYTCTNKVDSNFVKYNQLCCLVYFPSFILYVYKDYYKVNIGNQPICNVTILIYVH